uniref:WRKY domain-containing protein n=1 Tax=Leersia perrieri TaxID=77586 RepID=A0A0D9XNF3_9ORYZ
MELEAYWRMNRELEADELQHLLLFRPSLMTQQATSSGECLPPAGVTKTVSGEGRRLGRKRSLRPVDNNNVKLRRRLQEDDDGAANAKPLRRPCTKTRSYYRCTNSTEQGCQAKKTVQRNDGINGGAAARYTVSYISEHTCKSINESMAPVILETTIKPIATFGSACSAESPATSSLTSDIITASSTTWSSSSVTSSGETSCSGEMHGDCEHLQVAANEEYCWDSTTTTPAMATNYSVNINDGVDVEEMDLRGPIRSPVHIMAEANWMDDLFLLSNELIGDVFSGGSISQLFNF